MKSDRARHVGFLLLLQALYLVWLLHYGRFMSGDEIAYKAGGREWARSGHFIAPELLGYGSWRDPAHPYELRTGFGPALYTYAFGLFVKLCGFTPLTNAAFDALIHIFLGWATWALARALGPQLPYSAAMIAAAVTLPLGSAGRPDELGALLAMYGSVILLRRASSLRAVAAGILFALSAGTSIVAGGILMVWPLRAFWQQRRDGGWRAPAVFAVSAATGFLLIMLPQYLSTPEGLAQLTHNAQSSVGTTYRYAIENSVRYGKSHYLACAAALVIAAAHALHALRSGTWKQWGELWIPPLAALAALLIVLPVKYYYVWIVGPSFLAAALCALTTLPWRTTARAAVATAGLVFWVAASSRFAFMSLVRAALPPGQGMDENVAVIQRLIPPGSGVMTYDFWPALANSSYRIYSTEADPPWSAVDYIVLTGNGSGTPGQPQMLRPEQLPYIKAHFSPIYDHLNREAFHIGPLRTNSAYGYGPLILKRDSAPR